MSYLLLALGPIIYLTWVHDRERRQAAAQIAKLKEENKGLRKQLTESPERRGFYGNG